MKTKINDMDISEIIWRSTEPKLYYLKEKENRSRDKGMGKTNIIRVAKAA